VWSWPTSTPEREKSSADEVDGLFVQVDVSNSAEVEQLYRTVYDTYGRIDIAFNNAGISPPEDDSILTTGIDAWRRVQEVNLTSVYLCCQAVIPYMQRARKGSIINTASFVCGARLGHITDLLYRVQGRCARHVPRARRTVRPRWDQGQRSLPGPVNTPLLTGTFRQDPERAARRLVHVPLGRSPSLKR